MSSMVRTTTIVMLLATVALSSPAQCQDGGEWDRARAQLTASQRGGIAQAIERWKVLGATDRFAFNDYAGFVLAYPGFPEEEKLRRSAEATLERESPEPSRIIAYFDRFPPLTNPARARYALALSALQRGEARSVAQTAWRGGEMSDVAESAILSLYGTGFSQADHDARMNALLWAGNVAQAERQLAYASPEARTGFTARLALLRGAQPASLGLPVAGDALRDPGFIYNSVRQSRRAGNLPAAIQLLATRPPAATPPLDATKWVGELLSTARGADSASAVRIALSADDTFAPGADVSNMAFKLRDDYTSLTWLGGTKALWSLGDSTRAAVLFYRYGAAARKPQTRAKGFYWAGYAAAKGGDRNGATRYFEMGSAYPDSFYGMLSLERLGRSLPSFDAKPRRMPSASDRAEFAARPLTAAVRELAHDGFDSKTVVRFFKEISARADTDAERVLVADLAHQIGRRDLGAFLGLEATGDNYGILYDAAFPLIPNPPGTSFTMVHAITRQESQFAMKAQSHANAGGLMQLMPGTAREQAGKLGLSYSPAAIYNDADYNMRLGDGYFARMLSYYNGSYPLAVAAYNAGPGNVNINLRNLGDPRTGAIDWVEWIERFSLSETRGYIPRVLENAVVYEAMNPDRATYRGPNPLSRFLGKRTPG